VCRTRVALSGSCGSLLEFDGRVSAARSAQRALLRRLQPVIVLATAKYGVCVCGGGEGGGGKRIPA